MTTTTKRLVTTSELAELLGVSTRHLWNLEKEGVISSIRIGTSVRYDAEDVLTELKDGTRRE